MNKEKSTPTIDTPAIFAKIASTYDLVNMVLSFGIDRYWRKKLLTKINLLKDSQLQVLDLATGTGEVAILLAELDHVEKITAIDPVAEMLQLAQAKANQRICGKKIFFFPAVAEECGMANNSFDLITIAFGIRNFKRPTSALAECARLLRPGGQLLILEFTTPQLWWWRMLYLSYFRYVLPIIGRLISGHPTAYRYLNKSAEAFPAGADFLKLMENAGFADCKASSMTGGIVAIYQGHKR